MYSCITILATAELHYSASCPLTRNLTQARKNVMALLRASVIVFVSLIGLTHCEDFDDQYHRPWIHDHSSGTNWISIEEMGITKINTLFRFKVPDVRWLVIDGNKIESVPSEAFKFLPDLTHVSMAWNNISLIDANAFNNLEKLEVLDLDGNPIEVITDDRIFGKLISLKRLYLRQCQLRKFGVEEYPRALTHLYLSDNKLRYFHATNVTAMTHLYLNNNEAYYVSLSDMRSLRLVDLNQNKLRRIKSECTVSIDRLEEYSDLGDPWILWQNSMLCIHAIALQYLSLSNNNVGEIEQTAFSETPELIRVDLSDNLIDRLQANTFSDMLQLEDIVLNSNQIREIQGKEFANLPKLNTVSLNNNRISFVNENVFNNLGSSANNLSLHLNANDIKDLSSGFFRGIKVLKQLELSYNKIHKISSLAFADLPNLESILIKNVARSSPRSELVNPSSDKVLIQSDAFFNLPSLTSIVLQDNLAVDIEPRAFHSLRKLTTLDLSRNGIQSFSSEVLDDLPKLECLIIAGNEIWIIAPNTFPKQLRYLDLSLNPIRTKFSDWNIHQFDQLIKLNVTGVIDRLKIDEITNLPKGLEIVFDNAK